MILLLIIFHYSLYDKHIELLTTLSHHDYLKHLEKLIEYRKIIQMPNLRTIFPAMIPIISYPIIEISLFLAGIETHFSVVFLFGFSYICFGLTIQLNEDIFCKRNLVMLGEEYKNLIINEYTGWIVMGLIYLIIGVLLNIYILL
jgi:hypothetical protein